MCDVERSGIKGGARKVYYCEVGNFFIIYGMQLGISGAYGQNMVNISMDWLVGGYGVGWYNVMVCGGDQLGIYIQSR